MTIPQTGTLKINPAFCLIFGLLCISFSPIFVKLANIPGCSSAFYRLFFAGIFIIPYSILRGGLSIPFTHKMLSMLGGAFFAMDLALSNTSLIKINAGLTILFNNLTPIWVGLGALLVFKEIPKKVFWIGTLVAFIGTALTIGLNKILTLRIENAILLAISASFFYALYILTCHRIRKKLNTLHFMSWALAGGLITLLIFCILGNYPLSGFTLHTWISLFMLGIVSQMMGWLNISYSIAYFKSNNVSIVLLGQAVLTTVLAYFIIGETLSIHHIAGGIVVIAGIGLAIAKN